MQAMNPVKGKHTIINTFKKVDSWEQASSYKPQVNPITNASNIIRIGMIISCPKIINRRIPIKRVKTIRTGTPKIFQQQHRALHSSQLR